MATTVTYKGETLTTVTDQTKTLKTAGKYMEDDVTITDESSGGSGSTDYAIYVEKNAQDVWVPDKTHAQILGAYNNGKTLSVSYDCAYGMYAIAEGYYDELYEGLYYTVFEVDGTASVPTLIEKQYRLFSDDTIDLINTYTHIMPTGTLNVTSSGTKNVTNYASASIPSLTLPTSASSTSSGTSKATISRSTSAQYINIPTGFNDAAAYYTISATPNGSATGPSSLSGSSATVSTGTNTLTLTKTGVTTTPTVSAGYVSSATASTATVTLTASVTTKAATTYHPSTSAQTISSGTYLTGTQTINAVTTTNLSASNILSGITIKVGDSSDDDCVASVTGNVTFSTYYTGSSAPSSSLGVNGDIYLQTS